MTLSINDKLVSNNKVSVSELAEEFNMTSNYFSQFFKSNVGTTPKKYITDAKLSIAKSSLVHTNISIKEISYRLNYSDDKHFIRTFKKHVGVTPSSYRASSRVF